MKKTEMMIANLLTQRGGDDATCKVTALSRLKKVVRWLITILYWQSHFFA